MRKLTPNQETVLRAIKYRTDIRGLNRDQIKACVGSLVMNGYANISVKELIPELQRDLEGARNMCNLMTDVAKEAEQNHKAEVARLEAQVLQAQLEGVAQFIKMQDKIDALELASMVQEEVVLTVTLDEVKESMVKEVEKYAPTCYPDTHDLHKTILEQRTDIPVGGFQEVKESEWDSVVRMVTGWAWRQTLESKLGGDISWNIDAPVELVEKLADIAEPYKLRYMYLLDSDIEEMYPTGFHYAQEFIDSLDASLYISNPWLLIKDVMAFYGLESTGDTKKDFKKCMSKAHPDKGGHLEVMQVLNAIKDRVKNA